MSGKRQMFRVAVYLLLIKENKVLLLRRYNTGWKDGSYTLPAGHVDGNETVREAMAREAKEEAGIHVNPVDLEVVHVMHRLSDFEYIDFYLVPKTYTGEPHIGEPDKADDMQWFSLDKLPDTILPYLRIAIKHYKNNVTYSEEDWN